MLNCPDFAGGTPTLGWENGERVPITQLDPGSHDSFWDLLDEVRYSGGDPETFFFSFFADRIWERFASALREILAMTDTPLQRDQVRWSCDLALMNGESVGQLAKRHGISKQAFQQGCKKIRALVATRTQSARSPEAREKMRQRNCRRFKRKAKA